MELCKQPHLEGVNIPSRILVEAVNNTIQLAFCFSRNLPPTTNTCRLNSVTDTNQTPIQNEREGKLVANFDENHQERL